MPGRTHSRARHPVGSAAPSWVEGWSRLAGVILQMGSHLGVHLARVSPRPAVGGFKRRRLPRAATPAPGTPWRWPVAWSGSPGRVSQAWRESPPRFLPTTITARPSEPSRANQCSSSSCSACLPMRIGGLDQISSYVVPAGVSSGAQARNRSANPSLSAFSLARSTARWFTSTPVTDPASAGTPSARHAAATARPITPYPVPRSSTRPGTGRLGLAEKDGRPDVEPAPAVHARAADQLEPLSPHLAAEGFARERDRRIGGEVVVGHTGSRLVRASSLRAASSSSGG